MPEGMRVDARAAVKALPMLRTAPHPGFPTDLQSQVMAALCLADGESRIEESVFEARFRTAGELAKMGADISICGQEARIQGAVRLHGETVAAPELRGGAALVIAGLAADGITVVDDIYYIERGYEEFEKKLAALGAMIEKVSSEKEIQKFTLKVS